MSEMPSTSILRKIRLKKYSTVFTEKINENNIIAEEKARKLRDIAGESLASIIARHVVAMRLSKKCKAKLYTRAHSCKKTLMNLKPPTPITPWEVGWGNVLMCKVCAQPALYDTVSCQNCNEIAHASCLNPVNDEDDLNMDEMSAKVHDRMIGDRIMICAACIKFEQDEMIMHNKQWKALLDYKKRKIIASRILSTFRAYVTRKKFIRKKMLVTTIQSLVRMRRVRKSFEQWRRSQIRIILVECLKIPPNIAMVVFTVVDSYKKQQLFRLDKEPHKALTEAFLIPGTSSNVEFLITLIKSEGGNLFMAGQAQLSFRDIDPYVDNQVFSVIATPSIWMEPDETKIEKLSFSRAPPKPPSTVGNASGVNGTCTTEEEKVIEVRYSALSHVTSFCCFIYGPPLDVLRKPSEAYSANTGSKRGGMQSERKSRWWLAVAEMNILFYQYFGDLRPRYCCALIDCTATPVGELGVVLSFNDRRKWYLEFKQVHEVNRFIFSVTESRKASEGNSMYYKSAKLFRKLNSIIGL